MQRIRVLKLPMARRRLTTVPGPDPVMPAAHERASTDAHWSSCCTTPELGRSSRRWPNRRRVYAGTRQAAATAERPTSCHILGLEVAQRKKDLASRPSAACADAQVCRVTGRVAPSSFPKLALVFCSVSMLRLVHEELQSKLEKKPPAEPILFVLALILMTAEHLSRTQRPNQPHPYPYMP